MKWLFRISAGILLVLVVALGALKIWNTIEVRSNIKLAMRYYQGSAEDALIAYMMDEQKSAYVRSHVAIWTLGQLKSEKALPFLMDLSTNDPEGISCYGRHDSLVCQYEIHKAIAAIEKGGFLRR